MANELDIGEVKIGTKVAAAVNVKMVFEATNTCSTVDEIQASTGLDIDVIRECLAILGDLGIVKPDAGGKRYCNFKAVCTLTDKFDQISRLCKK